MTRMPMESRCHICKTLLPWLMSPESNEWLWGCGKCQLTVRITENAVKAASDLIALIEYELEAGANEVRRKRDLSDEGPHATDDLLMELAATREGLERRKIAEFQYAVRLDQLVRERDYAQDLHRAARDEIHRLKGVIREAHDALGAEIGDLSKCPCPDCKEVL